MRGRRFVKRDDADLARARVNLLVKTGRLPSASTLPCADCGDSERRHEYDHPKGYADEHHLHVDAVCGRCHRERERVRRLAAFASWLQEQGFLSKHHDPVRLARRAPRKVQV